MPYQLQLAVFAGGSGGALVRLGLDERFPSDGRSWPWATFIANVAGAFLLGYFTTRLQERLAPSTFRGPLLGTGFCGALTTFSTFQIELIELVRHGQAGLGLVYLVGSVGAGLAMVYVASAFTRRAHLR